MYTPSQKNKMRGEKILKYPINVLVDDFNGK